MFIKKGPLDVNLELIEQPKEKPRSDCEANERSFKCKKNMSYFYSAIYAAITGGEVGSIYKVDREILSDGLEINFHPDVTKKSRAGVNYTEIKVSSARSLTFLCSPDQAANYCYKLLERKTEGDRAPKVDYVLFRYGSRNDRNLFRLSNKELEQKLCDTTRLAVVLPLNLLLLLFFNSPLKSQNHGSSDSSIKEQFYFNVNGGRTLSQLFRGDAGIIDEMKERMKNSLGPSQFEPKDLMIDEIKHEAYISPNIRVNGRKMQKFDIMHYFLPDKQYKLWVDNFAKNHQKILEEIDIKDHWTEVLRRGGCSD